MINYLMEQGVDFPPGALKSELWAVVQVRLKVCPEYSINILVQKVRSGIIIEHLPPYHCKLNAVEMIWGIAKALLKIKRVYRNIFKQILPI